MEQIAEETPESLEERIEKSDVQDSHDDCQPDGVDGKPEYVVKDGVYRSKTTKARDEEDKPSHKNDKSSQDFKKVHREEKKVQSEDLDGALAIIVYEDPETHKVKFYFEIKPPDYYIKSERGKVALVGGGIETTDKSSIETLVREIREEITDKKAQDLLIEALKESPKPIYTVKDYVEGYESHNYVYLIKIKSKENWGVVASSGMTADAGNPTILPLEEIVGMKNSDFAFNHSSIIKRFVAETYLERFNRSNHNSSYFAFHPTLSQSYSAGNTTNAINFSLS